MMLWSGKAAEMVEHSQLVAVGKANLVITKVWAALGCNRTLISSSTSSTLQHQVPAADLGTLVAFLKTVWYCDKC